MDDSNQTAAPVIKLEGPLEAIMEDENPQNEISPLVSPDADVPYLDLNQDRGTLAVQSQAANSPSATDYVPDSTAVDSLTYHLDKLKRSIAKLELDSTRPKNKPCFPCAISHCTEHCHGRHATSPSSRPSCKRPRSHSRLQSPQRPSAFKRQRSQAAWRPTHQSQTGPYRPWLGSTAHTSRSSDSYICRHPTLCLGAFCDYPHVIAHASSVGPIPALFGCSHQSETCDAVCYQPNTTAVRLCYGYSSTKPYCSHWTNPLWPSITSTPRHESTKPSTRGTKAHPPRKDDPLRHPNRGSATTESPHSERNHPASLPSQPEPDKDRIPSYVKPVEMVRETWMHWAEQRQDFLYNMWYDTIRHSERPGIEAEEKEALESLEHSIWEAYMSARDYVKVLGE